MISSGETARRMESCFLIDSRVTFPGPLIFLLFVTLLSTIHLKNKKK